MRIIIILLLSILCSCATKKNKYQFDDIKYDSFSFTDVENRSVYVTYKYLNLQDVYTKYSKSGQINKLSDQSCFGTTDSVNFVSIQLQHIPQFRPYVSMQKYDVTYKSSDVADQHGNFKSLHIEKRIERMTVEQQSCWKDINGIQYYVTSERYAYH